MNDRLILLGVGGGAGTSVRPTSPPSAPHGMSSALVVDGHIYVVDAGQSSVRQLTFADPMGRGGRQVLRDVAAFFITHLHSDHTMDLGNYALAGFNQGWPDHPVPVIGPWPRPIRAPHYPAAGLGPDEELVAPGTREFVARLLHAYEADSLDRVLSSGRKATPLADRMVGVDITPPPGVDPGGPPDGPVEAWQVYEDDRLRVRATLVSHGNMYPSFAYRFDTERWSVVFSGDTSPSDNLIAMAAGADILVHEAIDPRFVERLFGPAPTEAQQQKAARVIATHSSAADVGGVAARAGVGTLILSHLAPANAPASYWAGLVHGFDGRVVVGEELAEFPLGC